MRPMPAKKLIASVLLVSLCTASLAACGRKGSLDTPYEAGMQAREDARKADEPLPPAPDEPVRDRPFILDKLI